MPEGLQFGAPHFLWLLAAPAVLLVAWVFRLVRRWSDLRRLREHRLVPVRERFGLAGDLPFWLCLIFATAAVIVATARPQGVTTVVGRAGVDIVVLQDGSASMHVKDVAGNRWQRAMTFLRLLGDSLSWNDDRATVPSPGPDHDRGRAGPGTLLALSRNGGRVGRCRHDLSSRPRPVGPATGGRGRDRDRAFVGALVVQLASSDAQPQHPSTRAPWHLSALAPWYP